MKHSSSPVRLLAEIIAIVAIAEALVVLVLPVLVHNLSSLAAGLVNVGLLVLLSSPTVYWRCMAALRRQAVPYTPVGPRTTHTLSMAAAIGMTAAAQLIGLLITAVIVLGQIRDLDKEAQFQFDRAVERMEAEVKRRFNHPLFGLKGARGTFAASSEINRRAFQAYVEARDLPQEFPGIRGFGFIARIERAELEAFVTRERTDNAAEFAVRSRGDAPDLFVIKYIEPLSDNRAAFGFDVGQEAIRREGAERAMVTGLPALTGKITLVQDGKQSPGVLYFLPVYRKGADPVTPAQHKKALVGLLYAPMVATELLAGLTKVASEVLRAELFDGEASQTERLLFDSAQANQTQAQAETPVAVASAATPGVAPVTTKPGALAMLSVVRPIEVGGRTLQLRLSSTPAFLAVQDRSSLALAGIAGALASMLAALTVWLLAVGRLRAQRLADRMTTDLDRLARVAQHTNNAVTIADPQMRITWVNEGFTRLTGYTLEQALGKTPCELVGSGKADPAALAKLQATIDQGVACRVEVLNRAKDGTEYWVDNELQPTRDAHGVLVGFMEIGTNITARKRAEHERQAAHEILAAQTAQMQVVLDHISQGVALIGADNSVVFQSRRVLNILEIPKHLHAAELAQIVAFQTQRGDFGADFELVEASARAYLRSLSSAAPMAPPARYIRRTVTGRTLEIGSAPLPDGGLVRTFTDVTSYVEAQAQAEQASIAKGQFLANMSHEIRTPMNAILGMLTLLQNTELSTQQQDFASKTEDAARSLLGLLNDILDFSKVEAGKMTLDPRPFNLDKMLGTLAVILSANIGAKPLVYRSAVDDDVPRGLLGDDMRLQQVLINLGGNAIKFTPRGEVLLRVRMVERTAADVVLEFTVSDTGIGIATENQAHIFNSFSQAEASTTRRYGGTGLGLSISSRLVKLLGGALQLSSKVNQGSNFYFAIRLLLADVEDTPPSTAVQADGAPDAPAHAKPQRLRGLRILVVEDNKINQMVAKGLLTQEGAYVELADDGQQGVAAVAASQPPFHAVLMDIQMPVMDGYTATRAIRQELGLATLPIIAMTANVMASDRTACLEAGMDDHVGKPFELEHLVSTLQRLCPHPQAE